MRDALEQLVELLGRRAAIAPGPERSGEAVRLKGHIEEFLLPRLADLDAPLVVVILGSTGSGKSSLFNALAGESLSEVGVLRPTTRVAQVLTRPGQPLPDVVATLDEQGLANVIERPLARRHLVLVDSPDIDSIEAANRALARRLLEAADLVVFVTTDTRYADEVPWALLKRAGERGVPLLTLINRLPNDRADADAVLADYRRLLTSHGLDTGEVAGVEFGELDQSGQALAGSAIAPVESALDHLVDDAAARRELIEQSVEAAVSAIPGQVARIVDAIEREAATRSDLVELVRRNYAVRSAEIAGRIDRGSFLRSEVLREWQDFVGASKVARVIAEGVGKAAATIRSFFQTGPSVSAGEVQEAALSDLTELVVSETDQAASSTASAWSQRPFGDEAVAEHPGLWAASTDLGERFENRLDHWAARIGSDIMEMGEQRRGLARAASLGVNVVGTGAILAVFVHTGGLTGAEVGIAAATAAINQALLDALFGEANVARFVENARSRLDEVIDEELSIDRQRFEEALAIDAASSELAAEMNATVERLAR